MKYSVESILSFIVNIVVVVGWLSNIIKKAINKNILYTFFGGRKMIVYLPLRTHQDSNRNVIANEDFHSIMQISKFFTINGISSQFVEIKPNEIINPNEDSLFVCGPKSNKYVHEKPFSSDPYFQFIEKGDHWSIMDLTSKCELTSPQDKDPTDKIDYGYLNKFRKNGKTIIVVAGIHSFGTLGVIDYITRVSNLKKIVKEFPNKNISGVISSKFNSDKLEIESSQILIQLKEY